MKFLFALFAIGASGLTLSSPPAFRTHGNDTIWTVVLSTRYKNNIDPFSAKLAPSWLQVGSGSLKAGPTLSKPKSCAVAGIPKMNEILMSCKDGELCLEGRGFQSRATTSVAMIQEAVNLLQQAGTPIRDFDVRKIYAGDNFIKNLTSRLGPMKDDVLEKIACDYDYAYSLPWTFAETCRTQLLPDFTFDNWVEAGLLPDFTSLTTRLHDISNNPAEKQVCGWAGNPKSNYKRQEFAKLASPSLFEVISPSINHGTGGGRLTMEAQTQQWACMVDLPGNGYSGRVPMLLHTGRPLLMVDRDGAGHFTDRVWYADMLKPNLHYIPVYSNFSNLEEAAKKALSEEGLQIAARAQRLAADNLTRHAAIEHIATLLAAI